MDPERELERMLKEHGAVLIRTGNHMVYKLPNGQKFVRSKTPSDALRAAKKSLCDLRHALGIVHVVAGKEELTMPIESSPTTTQAPAPAVPVPAQPSTPLKDRLEAAVAAEESRQEKLLAEAQQVERRIHMLKAILPYLEDATAEDALRALLPALPQPAAVAPPPLPPPPQIITDRVQITRELVFAATQTFNDSFTINDVVSLMTGGRHLDPPERLRVRACIGQAMSSLSERGEVIKEVEHFGRRQAIWRKVELDGRSKASSR